MNDLIALAGIVTALSVGTVSPGPSFVVVAQTAVSSSRARALQVALGMGAGGVAFALAALVGLQAVLFAVPALYVGLKVVGGLYLCFLGLRMLRAAKSPLPQLDANATNSESISGGLWLGFLTQFSNPKTAVVYAGVFAAFLPATYTTTFAAVLVGLVFCIEAGWYALVALLLSSPSAQRIYFAYKLWIDRVTGVVMSGLGLKLLAETAKP